LPGEVVFSDGRADTLQRFEGFALRVKRCPSTANECLSTEWRFYDVLFVDFGDGRERGDLPTFLLEDMADEVVLMQTLHDDDDRALGLVIEARIERSVKPFIGGDASALRHGVTGFQRIVDDDDVCAAAGENAADRRRQAKAALCCDKFLQRRPGRREARREQTAIPGGPHDRAAVAGELVR
jgi:hypothetical protein